MSDFLRITTPLVNKNQTVQPKPGLDPAGAFNIQNSVKVIQTHNQSEILKQNNGLREESDTPTLLLNLLKDPGVTVSYLKNIFMLEELYKLLPANNKTVTKEIENIFNALLIKPEDLAQEMKNQENSSTVFKGELFDLLRNISENNRMKPEVQIAIAKFLRSLYSTGNQRDILDSVANNLSFLRNELAPSKMLSEKLDNLISSFRADDSQLVFQELKAETLGLIKEIEDSILFTPKLSKILSILTYNLSRYNDNSEYVSESAFRLRQYLSPQEKQQFNILLESLIAELRENGGFLNRSSAAEEESQVISLLVKLISQQAEQGKASVSDSVKLEGILHSLLSSPCNFTPLLHFILPLQFDDMRAFAEIWINPESDEKDMPEDVSSGMHILMVIDVDSVGRFEAEFFVYNSTIDFLLFCPKGYETGYEELMRGIPKILYGTEYRLGKTQVAALEKTRSLMDVFKSLPYRRVGVDVKV